jgi:hypothetical protein
VPLSYLCSNRLMCPSLCADLLCKCVCANVQQVTSCSAGGLPALWLAQTAVLVYIHMGRHSSVMHATGCCRPLSHLCPAFHCSEMAPPQLRGRLNQLFQIVLTFAIFAAQVQPLLCMAT